MLASLQAERSVILRIKRVGDVPSELLYEAAEAVASQLPLEVIVDPFKEEPDPRAFDWNRVQYVASELVKILSKGKMEKELIIYLVDADAYEPGLNFVFGIALPTVGAGAVFLRRLRPSFYGEEDNWDLFVSRVRKEVVHELGHLLGLPHCPNPKCVMSFSNSIEDVDYKGERFCDLCLMKLGVKP